MEPRPLGRTFALGLGIGIPISVALVVAALVLRSTSAANPVATSSSTGAPLSPTAAASSAVVLSSQAASSKQPQGTVTIDKTSNGLTSRNDCSATTLWVTNRSDTAVKSIQVTFRTSYQALGEPISAPERDGPVVTLTQAAGLAAFQSGTFQFAVCVPSLAGKVAPLDGFEQIDAVPAALTWTWFSS